jgi:peptidoglycan/xylan/chitin deacetylase (PgdA/CDA1 family)
MANGKILWLFADGYEVIMAKEAPILRAYGMVGNCIVNTKTIGNTNKMSLADLTVLSGLGWEIGSHGYTHVNPTTLPDSPPNPLAGSLQQHLQASRTWLLANGFSGAFYGPPLGCSAHVKAKALTAGYTQIVQESLDVTCTVLPGGWTYSWTNQETYDRLEFDAALAALIGNPTYILFACFAKVGPPPVPETGEFEAMVAQCACAGIGCTVMSAL